VGGQRTRFFESGRIPLFFGLDIVLGEIKLVNLVKDWEEMEQYASRASSSTGRAYQTGQSSNKVQIRVLVGKFGYAKEFSNLDDPLFQKIIDFCSQQGFLNIGRTVPDDQFFK
jgi:hypothetical protein